MSEIVDYLDIDEDFFTLEEHQTFIATYGDKSITFKQFVSDL